MKNILLLAFLSACSSIKIPPSQHMSVKNVEAKYEVNDCVEDWTIAQLSGLPNKEAQDKINASLMSKIAEKSCDHSEDVAGEEYTLRLLQEKVFPNYIVIESVSTFSTGGPNPKVSASCIVYDLNTGEKVDFELMLHSKHKAYVEQLVINQLWEGKREQYEEYKHVLSASSKSLVEIVSHKVCPNGNGLVIQFGTQEVAPASFENPEIQVPKKDWNKVFKLGSQTKELFGEI